MNIRDSRISRNGDQKTRRHLLLVVSTVVLAVGNFRIASRGAGFRRLNSNAISHSGQSICNQNPYLLSLTDEAIDVANKMDAWTRNIGRWHTQARDPLMLGHDHRRFFPFDAMTGCKDLPCIGGPCGSDESKMVCGLEELNKNYGSGTRRCVVYSIGGNNLWEFERDILDSTPCEVHTFDCTGPKSRFQVPESKRLHFHHVCLGAEHEDAIPADECGDRKCGETWTLLEMQKHLGHNNIDLLKIDIEGFEWPLFESWPELFDKGNGEVVLPFQVLVEIHYRSQFAELRPPKVGRSMDFRFGRDMVHMQAHFLRMGYAVVNRDDNISCRHCTELTLVRLRCPQTGAYYDPNSEFW